MPLLFGPFRPTVSNSVASNACAGFLGGRAAVTYNWFLVLIIHSVALIPKPALSTLSRALQSPALRSQCVFFLKSVCEHAFSRPGTA